MFKTYHNTSARFYE